MFQNFGQVSSKVDNYENMPSIKKFLKNHGDIKISQITKQSDTLEPLKGIGYSGIDYFEEDGKWEISICDKLVKSKSDLSHLLQVLAYIHILEEPKTKIITANELYKSLTNNFEEMPKDIIDFINITYQLVLNMYNVYVSTDYLIKTKEFDKDALKAFIKNYSSIENVTGFTLFYPIALLAAINSNGIKMQDVEEYNALTETLSKHFVSHPDSIFKSFKSFSSKANYEIDFDDISRVFKSVKFK